VHLIAGLLGTAMLRVHEGILSEQRSESQ
jgi:hypothetical protein